MRTDRRNFLKTGAAAAVSLAAVSFPLKPLTAADKSEGEQSELAVCLGSDPAVKCSKAVTALGGMEKFIKKGDRVFIKPNSITNAGPQLAINTHPAIVGEVVKMCFAAGASQVVAGMRDSLSSSRANGTQKTVEAAGGTIRCTTNPADYAEVRVHRGLILRNVNIMRQLLEFDVFINIPIAKHHAGSQLTLGLKNYMGLIPRNDALNMHRSGLDQSIADLATIRKANLTIIDATRILLNNGPSGPGPVREINKVFASSDPLAADAYAATLFELEPRSVRHLQAAFDMGLGEIELKNMKIEELKG